MTGVFSLNNVGGAFKPTSLLFLLFLPQVFMAKDHSQDQNHFPPADRPLVATLGQKNQPETLASIRRRSHGIKGLLQPLNDTFLRQPNVSHPKAQSQGLERIPPSHPQAESKTHRHLQPHLAKEKIQLTPKRQRRSPASDTEKHERQNKGFEDWNAMEEFEMFKAHFKQKAGTPAEQPQSPKPAATTSTHKPTTTTEKRSPTTTTTTAPPETSSAGKAAPTLVKILTALVGVAGFFWMTEWKEEDGNPKEQADFTAANSEKYGMGSDGQETETSETGVGIFYGTFGGLECSCACKEDQGKKVSV